MRVMGPTSIGGNNNMTTMKLKQTKAHIDDEAEAKQAYISSI